MPRPKGAGRDPRLGKVSSRVLDEILSDSDARRRKKFLRRIERMQDRVYRMAMAEGGCETYGPDGPTGDPPCLVMGQAMNQIALAEEVIGRIREREVKIDGMAAALFEALNPVEESEQERRPVEITIRYADEVDSGDTTQQAAEPGASGSQTGQ